MGNELTRLLWLMRYSWRLEGEDHVRIYPDGKVQVMKFNEEPHLDKGYITPRGHEVTAEFESIAQLLNQLNNDERRKESTGSEGTGAD